MRSQYYESEGTNRMLRVLALDMAEVGVLAYPEFLPAPAITMREPEVVSIVPSSTVPLLGEELAVAKANAG